MGYFVFLNCQDFYLSCERLFNPSLEGKPTIILSQDKWVIACSQEALSLKIPVGISYLKIKDFCLQKKIHVCLSNYKLYGDLFQRMMNILLEMELKVEVDSIGEVFIQFPEAMSAESVEAIAHEIRQKIHKWIGLPMTMGLASTRTLAKIAHDKAQENQVPIFSLCCSYEKQGVLETFSIHEVWGIDENHLLTLNQMNVHTAQQFCDQDALLIRQKVGTTLERIFWELRGLSCFVWEDLSVSKHSVSHSFDTGEMGMEKVAESLSASIMRACAELEELKAFPQGIYIFLESTGNLGTDRCRYHGYGAAISIPSAREPNLIMAQVKNSLQKIYREKEGYKKCGMIFMNLLSDPVISKDELSPEHTRFKQGLNWIDAYFAKDPVVIPQRGGLRQEWKMRSENRAQRCENHHSSLAFAKAGSF